MAIDLVLETALDGHPAGWFAPEYKLLDEAWREMKSILGDAAIVNEQQKRLVLRNGGIIDAWAFDRNPNAGRSRKYKRVVIDEAAHCVNLEQTWTKGIRPTLTDYKGDAWFLSSPKGSNYFHSLFKRGQALSGDWKSWQEPSYNNPRLDAAEIDSARDDLPDASFRQEYLAEFLADEEWQLIPTSWIERCVNVARSQGKSGLRRLSIDISKGTGRDRTAPFVGDDLGLLSWQASNRIDVPGAAQLTFDLSRDYGVRHEDIVYDVGGWAGPDMTRYLEALGIMDALPYRGGASGGTRFKNKRTRSAWKLRQRLDPDRPRLLPNEGPDPKAGGWSLRDIGRIANPATSEVQPPFHIPRSPLWDDLSEELASLRYQHGKAEIELETKEKCMARLGRSPDLADTLIMMASLWGDD